MTIAVVLLVIFLILYLGRNTLANIFLGGGVLAIAFPLWIAYVLAWPSYANYQSLTSSDNGSDAACSAMGIDCVDAPLGFSERMHLLPPFSTAFYLDNGEGAFYLIYVANFILFLIALFWLLVLGVFFRGR